MGKKWLAFKKEPKTVLLPSVGLEVTLKEPDIISRLLTGEITLSDSLFSMFVKSTEDGEQSKPLEVLQDDPEAGKGLTDFLDILAMEAFVEPILVRDEKDADYETTVPISDLSMIDKMLVMQSFPEMFSQLDGLNSFRPQANGTLSPTSESE